MSHIIEIGELLYTITMVIMTANGELSDPIEFKLVDGNIPCSDTQVSCIKKYDNHYEIWININQLNQRDYCDRDPIYHEFMHVKWWGEDIHNICLFT